MRCIGTSARIAGMPALVIPLKYLAPILGGKVDMLKHLAVLRADGWKIATVWECEIKKTGLLARLRKFFDHGGQRIHSRSAYFPSDFSSVREGKSEGILKTQSNFHGTDL
jgi:hypothetical protein